MVVEVSVKIKAVLVAYDAGGMMPLMTETTHIQEIMPHFFSGRQTHCLHPDVSLSNLDACLQALEALVQAENPGLIALRQNKAVARFLAELDVFCKEIKATPQDLKLTYSQGEHPKELLITQALWETLSNASKVTVAHVDRISRSKVFFLSSAGVTAAVILLVSAFAAINAGFLTTTLVGPIAISLVIAIGMACAIAGGVQWRKSCDRYHVFAGTKQGEVHSKEELSA